MSTAEIINHLKIRSNQLCEEKQDLEPGSNRAINKRNELENNLNKYINTCGKCRRIALISALLTPLTIWLMPFCGIVFAIIPFIFLVSTITCAIRRFKAEDKIYKTQDFIELCQRLVDSYKKTLNELNNEIQLLNKEINEFTLKQARMSNI